MPQEKIELDEREKELLRMGLAKIDADYEKVLKGAQANKMESATRSIHAARKELETLSTKLL